MCVVLHELVTGNVPFAGDTPFEMFKAIVEGEPQTLPLGGEVDAQLVAILARGLAKKPEDRFGSARELGVAFATWLLSTDTRRTCAAPRFARSGCVRGRCRRSRRRPRRSPSCRRGSSHRSPCPGDSHKPRRRSSRPRSTRCARQTSEDLADLPAEATLARAAPARDHRGAGFLGLDALPAPRARRRRSRPHRRSPPTSPPSATPRPRTPSATAKKGGGRAKDRAFLREDDEAPGTLRPRDEAAARRGAEAMRPRAPERAGRAPASAAAARRTRSPSGRDRPRARPPRAPCR
jgi:serine/threonine protein kinase